MTSNLFSHPQINIKGGSTGLSTDKPGIYWSDNVGIYNDNTTINIGDYDNKHKQINFFGARINYRSTWDSNVHLTLGIEDARHAFLLYNNFGRGVFLAWDTTGWSANSDRRIKRDITPIESVMDKVLQLNPVYFNYINDASDSEVREGFIAQEVETLFPSVVSNGTYSKEINDYLKGLCPTNLIPYLVKAIQEQHTLITNLTSKVDELSSKVDELTTKINTNSST
jgi:hypothetical protein